MSSASLVIEILCEPNIRRIDFNLAGFHVNSSRFGGVLRAIMHGRIGIPEWNELTPRELARMARVDGSYYPEFHEIIIDPRKVSSSTYGRSGVVHECVHAIHDLYRAEATTMLSGEVAAFIAQCLYLRLASSGQPGGSPSPPLRTILDLANDLVIQLDLERRPGTTIPHSAYQSLRRAVSAAYPDVGEAQRMQNIGVPSTPARIRPSR